MSYQELKILKLSDTGEVVRRVRCLQGRVTVFRAGNDAELDVYSNALAGVDTKTKFSLLLDDKTFNRAQHNFIGFSDSDISGPQTLSDYFTLQGAPVESLESWLIQFGLGGLNSAKISKLTEAERRVAQILAATFSNAKILILNDPFSVVPERLREPIAEHLIRYAWEKKAIVVVVKLTYRPQAWIDNEFVTRVQLERTRSMTIGFGSGTPNSAEAVQAVRNELKKQVSSSYSKLSNYSTQYIVGSKQSSKKPLSIRSALYAGALVLLGGVALIAFPTLYSPNQRVATNVVQPVQKPRAELKAVNILDIYPETVASSILEAFDATMPIAMVTDSPLPQYQPLQSPPINQISYSEPDLTQTDPSSLVRAGEDHAQPVYPDGVALDSQAELERERIRQRFLEAVARAQEEQGEN